ncbi:hypothetical protein Tco_1442284 [Tanacetum coccineum]
MTTIKLTLEEYVKNAKDEYGWKMVETEVMNLLKISDDLFSCETPLGMTFEEFKRLSFINDDLFSYEVKIPKPTCAPYVEQQTGYPKKKDLRNYEWKMSYDECEKIYAEAVILIDKDLYDLLMSYKRQFEDYLEIKKQRSTYRKDIDIEYNPSNMEFAEWLASKFSNHRTMDWYTKNALWVYWGRGDDEVKLNNEELSNIEDKSYNGFKNKFTNKWKKVTPWSKDEVPYEEVDHICEPFKFKDGRTKWPTCYWNDVKLEEYWWKINDHECSLFTNWENLTGKTRTNNLEADGIPKSDPYLDIYRTIVNTRKDERESIRDEPELEKDNDDDTEYLEDYLI